MRFFILDVFASQRYSGNQLAVVMAEPGLPGAEMQAIAREFNFSETTFVIPDHPGAGHRVRIFTPSMEVPFAGHPVLGTAYAIRRHLCPSANELALELDIGRIMVRAEADALWMRQIEPVFGAVASHSDASRVLGLGPEELDARYPIEEVSTGLPFIIVPLRSAESMGRIALSMADYNMFVKDRAAKGLMVFSPNASSAECRLRVRMFAPAYGILEDPATGSGSGCLAGWIVRHGYLGSDRIDIQTEQGVEMGRPSRLMLRAWREGGGINVEVGGRVIPVAEGGMDRS